MAGSSNDLDLTRLPIVDAVSVTSLLAPCVGLLTAFGAFLTGAPAAGIGSRLLGEPGALIGGALATAIVGVLVACLCSSSVRPLLGTVFLLLVAFLFALGVNWHIPARLDWPMYRWALAGTGIGIFFGGLFEPTRAIRDGTMRIGTKGWVFVALSLAIAAIIKIMDRGPVGSFVAGAVNGALSGLFIASMAAAVGGKDAVELFGSYLTIPLAGVALGALGAGCGGWKAWSKFGHVEQKSVHST